MISIDNSWDEFFAQQTKQDYYNPLQEFVAQQYAATEVYPARENIFTAFREVPPENIRVVILGQDPYHQPGQSHGMAFSVQEGVKRPPSLVNICKEIKSDLGCEMSDSGYLLPWAKQGVFMLNAVLTVERGKPESHRKKGWEKFTDAVIAHINETEQPKVFMLWGNFARQKKALITSKQHLILEAAHPSPLAAYNGFFGCKHFSKANNFLISNGFVPINWSL